MNSIIQYFYDCYKHEFKLYLVIWPNVKRALASAYIFKQFGIYGHPCLQLIPDGMEIVLISKENKL